MWRGCSNFSRGKGEKKQNKTKKKANVVTTLVPYSRYLRLFMPIHFPFISFFFFKKKKKKKKRQTKGGFEFPCHSLIFVKLEKKKKKKKKAEKKKKVCGEMNGYFWPYFFYF